MELAGIAGKNRGDLLLWKNRQIGATGKLAGVGDPEALQSGQSQCRNHFAANGSVAIGRNRFAVEVKLNSEAIWFGLDLNEVEKLRRGISAVEARAMELEKFEFSRAGRFGGGDAFPRNVFDLVNEPDESAWHAIWIGVFVVGEASAKIFGLTDVENSFAGAAHNVDAGLAGSGPEEFVAETFDQRLHQWKETELRAHWR